MEQHLTSVVLSTYSAKDRNYTMESTMEQAPLLPVNKEEKKQTSFEKIKKSFKRKQNNNNDQNIDDEENTSSSNPVMEVFLKIIYPLSSCMEKNILIGIFKTLDFNAGILLQHGKKSVLFTENGWRSFIKHINLVECYHLNKVYGRKTSKRLEECDIEIDNIKLGSTQGVRFRDLSIYNSKVILNSEEFDIMLGVIPAINRYLEQLAFSGTIIKDYILDTTAQNTNVQVIYGPVDSSIYNRLPQEIDLYRKLVDVKDKPITAEQPEEKLPEEVEVVLVE